MNQKMILRFVIYGHCPKGWGVFQFDVFRCTQNERYLNHDEMRKYLLGCFDMWSTALIFAELHNEEYPMAIVYWWSE